MTPFAPHHKAPSRRLQKRNTRGRPTTTTTPQGKSIQAFSFFLSLFSDAHASNGHHDDERFSSTLPFARFSLSFSSAFFSASSLACSSAFFHLRYTHPMRFFLLCFLFFFCFSKEAPIIRGRYAHSAHLYSRGFTGALPFVFFLFLSFVACLLVILRTVDEKTELLGFQ